MNRLFGDVAQEATFSFERDDRRGDEQSGPQSGRGGQRDRSQEPCKFYQKGMCNKGAACPFRHVRGEKMVVCKHWLRGLCKKGDMCEFLHEYDQAKMPECYFYSKYGECTNPECPYLHISPEEKNKECLWYTRGFCKHGPRCRHRHIKRPLCEAYMAGFCPDGPNCPLGHPKWETPRNDPTNATAAAGSGIPGDDARRGPRPPMVCYRCGQPGHKAAQCQNEPMANRRENKQQQQHQAMHGAASQGAANLGVAAGLPNDAAAMAMMQQFAMMAAGRGMPLPMQGMPMGMPMPMPMQMPGAGVGAGQSLLPMPSLPQMQFQHGGFQSQFRPSQ